MLSISRVSSSLGAGKDWLGEALLNLSFLRMGITRASSGEELPDHLRRDIGLLPRQKSAADARDLRW